jgi:hypothetical protein
MGIVVFESVLPQETHTLDPVPVTEQVGAVVTSHAPQSWVCPPPLSQLAKANAIIATMAISPRNLILFFI